MVDSSATEHQISDGVGVSIRATPADGFTRGRAHPDHAFLSPQFGDPEGVVHVGCPVAPVRIELAPCGGLDCDGVGHWFRLTEVIIPHNQRTIGGMVDTPATCPGWGREGIE